MKEKCKYVILFFIFEISVFSFFCLINLFFNFKGVIYTFLLVALASILLAYKDISLVNLVEVIGKKSMCNCVKKIIATNLFYAFTSLGISWFYGSNFYHEKINAVGFRIFFEKHIPFGFHFEKSLFVASSIMTIFAALFLFVCIFYFFEYLKENIFDEIFSSLSKTERFTYGCLFVIFCIVVIISFWTSRAFYAGDWNVIYTSDSPGLADNAFLDLLHGENDIRQPLFASFAMPFFGAAFFVSKVMAKILPHHFSIFPYFISFVHIAMMIFANILIAKMMRLSEKHSIIFVILFSVSYTAILHTIMIEQFQVAFFYLILFLYVFVQERHFDLFCFYGAAGTLTTSWIFAPLYAKIDKTKNLKDNFFAFVLSMRNLAEGFIFILIVSCRIDVIFNSIGNLKSLLQFSGKGLSFENRLMQFISFVQGIFVAPKSHIINGRWHLQPVTEINIAGVVFLVVAICGFILNRKKIICKVAMFWIAYSFLILCVIGWGTAENGLILYSLYFQWAFAILIFSFITSLSKWLARICIDGKLCLRMSNIFIATVGIICGVAMLVINSKSIYDMIIFAGQYYPR